MSVINRFSELRTRIKESTNRDEIKKSLRSETIEFGYRFLAKLKATAPSGEQWTDPDEVFDKRKIFSAIRSPRPSLRQHGITLEQGWQDPKVDFRGSSSNRLNMSLVIQNLAPQAKFVSEGTQNDLGIYPGSDAKKLYFWHFREKVEAFAAAVGHYGIDPNPFIRHAHEAMQPDFQRLINQIISNRLDKINE
jgi:hypothetical protein